MSVTGSATARGAAAALMLATSRLRASTGRFQLGGGAVADSVRAIRAKPGQTRTRREGFATIKAGSTHRCGSASASRDGEGSDRDCCVCHCVLAAGRIICWRRCCRPMAFSRHHVIACVSSRRRSRQALRVRWHDRRDLSPDVADNDPRRNFERVGFTSSRRLGW
jgi:hypothetical protein